MKKLILITTVGLIFLGVHVRLQAQGYATKPYTVLEWYAGAGTTHYFGDVGGKSGVKHGLIALIDAQGVDIEQTRLAGALGFRYIRNKTLAFNAQISPLWLSGSDKGSMFQENNLNREYSFKSYMIEGSLTVEIFLANRLTGQAPYLILGYGGALFNSKYYNQYLDPKDVSKDHWRNKNYNESFPDTFRWTGTILSGVTIAGFGVRLPSINKDVAQNIELRYHYSAKDILDGYSLGTYSAKRKNPTHYGQIGDSYIVLSYQIIFNLDKTFVYDHKGRISR